MIVLVKWEEHNRQYQIGIHRFLQSMDINVDNAQIQKAIIKLLEQQEMKYAEPED